MHLIDGHNLIPYVPGLSLSEIDDEQRLIDALVSFCAATGRSVEVFFDKAPPGRSGMRRYGNRLVARFIREGKTADEAIRERLAQLGRAARNVTVVSSDNQVRAEARSRQAQVVDSGVFASTMLEAARTPPAAPHQPAKDKGAKAVLSPREMQEWLDLFGGEPDISPPPLKKQPKKRPGGSKKL